jgi:hypothetical protein
MPSGKHIDRFDSAVWCGAKAATLRIQAERGANATSRARAFEIAAEWEAKADALDRPASVTAGSSNRPRLGERTLLSCDMPLPDAEWFIWRTIGVSGRMPARGSYGICVKRAHPRRRGVEPSQMALLI